MFVVVKRILKLASVAAVVQGESDEQQRSPYLEHELERREIAGLLSVELELVDRWLLLTEARFGESVTDMGIELLELKLAARRNVPADG